MYHKKRLFERGSYQCIFVVVFLCSANLLVRSNLRQFILRLEDSSEISGNLFIFVIFLDFSYQVLKRQTLLYGK